ncbi:MAG: efflux RND transporter permease subunit, partial [Gammaproteobacteria bacterium]|nr:efflux RND transporter permease subunit [Gammaproteobacteria bacterium]
VEAVHAKLEQNATMTPYRATQQVLGEIGGAIVAITLVMTAVFVPVGFMTGPVGVFYRQFSITMASSIVISCVVALSLTPVLCAMLLKNQHGRIKRRTPVSILMDAFNRWFERLTGHYVHFLQKIVTRRSVTALLLTGFVAGTLVINQDLPGGFIPGEDQGQIYAIIQTPPGSTLEATNQVARELQEVARQIEGVSSVSSLAGYEILTEGRGSNAGTCLINLEDWANREQSVHEIIEELEEKTRNFGAAIEFFEPPAVPGYGAASGLALRLLDKTNGTDYHEFDQINQEFMAALGKRKELSGLFTFYAANYPQYELEIDNQAAMQKGVSIGKAMDNLNILIGST